MHVHKFPLAVRLIGFAPGESAQIATALAHAPKSGHAYFCLHEDSLQEPDLFIANGDDLKALAWLIAAEPSVLQPALIVGSAAAEFPFPQLERPLDLHAMFALLDRLNGERDAARTQMRARALPYGVDRRRQHRLDLDLTDPADYERRRRAPPNGAVLIVDKGGALRDHVAKLLGTRKLAIEWTDSAHTAVRLCEETPVSLVMINTSAPGMDPYAVCAQIKELKGGERIAVVLLVNQAFNYNIARARAAGVRGLLDKPVADCHLLGALRKLLSLPA